MIKYMKCSEVEEELVFNAFQGGFSDYIIKFNFSKEEFCKRFFGPEGNCLENSFIAIDGEKPVGVILGGIKNYEGVKTMRCGTLAISPNYRGLGISNALYDLHKAEALKNDCKQLFLEVICGNDRAINFYKKLGYEKIYDISFYTLSELTQLKCNSSIEIKKVSFDTFENQVNKVKYFHINWQNDLEYMKSSEDNTYYAAFKSNEILGCICISSMGRISYLMINRDSRGEGIASSLINEACTELNLSRLTTCFTNNSLLEGFFKHLGFTKEKLAQYEMYITL